MGALFWLLTAELEVFVTNPMKLEDGSYMRKEDGTIMELEG